MVRNMGVARDLGYLRVPGGLLVDLREAEEMPPGDVVLIPPARRASRCRR